MVGRCFEGSTGVRAGLSGARCRPTQFLMRSRGHIPLMGLKPARDPPTNCRGRAEINRPAWGGTESHVSVLGSRSLG